MLSSFDWLRQCQTGAELLATLNYLEDRPHLFHIEEMGPPHSALDGPCRRCWIYPRSPSSGRKASPYCKPCRAILAKASRLGRVANHSTVIWGFVNRLPKQLESGEGFRDSRVFSAYVHEPNRFLLMMHRQELRAWLRELAIYHGNELTGVIQILPTTSPGTGVSMGDILCRAVYQETRFPLDRLRVRFFSAPYQLLQPHTREQLGLLTFEVSDFLGLLEMAAVFRTLLYPDAQRSLHELLSLTDASEEQFYWGRFLGHLSPEARDMLSAWRIRQWPRERVKLLYELTRYVAFYQSA